MRVLALRAAWLVVPASMLAASVLANTYTVTTTADSGAGSLRQAILDANGNPGADAIQFDIPGASLHTITPATPLPSVVDALTIDGYTQSGSSPNDNGPGFPDNSVHLIEIDGTNTWSGSSGALGLPGQLRVSRCAV